MDGDVESKLTKRDLEQLMSTAVESHRVTRLTQPGDNLGSVMLALDVTLKTGNLVHLVAKAYPDDPTTVRIFNSPLTMRKEIDAYRVVSPEYRRIQEDAGVPPTRRLDVFCACLGARATRRGDDGEQLADKHAVILLENLKPLGYSMADRLTGMDLPHAAMVVSHLARFHATAIAVKQNKPLLFRNKFLKALVPVKLRMGDFAMEENVGTSFLDQLLSRDPACRQHEDKLREIFAEDLAYKYSEDVRPATEPFATVVHNDLWVNNVMFKHVAPDPAPVDLKIVDLQVSYYGSPAADLVFFLFTSVHDDVLAENFDGLIRLYHDSFVEWLGLLGCKTARFSWDNFAAELDVHAILELPHALLMLNVILAHKDQVHNGHSEEDPFPINLNDDLVRKASQAVRIFSEKGWL